MRSPLSAAAIAAALLLGPPAARAAQPEPPPPPQVVHVAAARDDPARALIIGGGLALAVTLGLLAARAAPRRRPPARGTAPATPPAAVDDVAPPALAPGVELLGVLPDHGYAEPRFLVRLGDGRMIGMTRLAYAVAAQVDGLRGYDAIAERAGEDLGRRMCGDDARFLVRERLRPAGVVAGAPAADVRPATPVLSLMMRAAIVPARPVHAAAGALRHLFAPPVVAAVLAGWAALDVWLVAIHGVGRGVGATVAQPAQMLVVLGLLVLSAAFHELGHAAACRYGGATPGAVGVGIYLIWPVFYNDITDSYRLGRAGRLRTDLGGLYFNVVAILAVAAAYAATGTESLLAFVMVQQIQMLLQFMPWVRLDGYYVVSDLAGVPNLFAHVRSSLRGSAHGLTRRAGAIVRGWVVTALLALAAVMTLLALHAPGTFRTAASAARAQAAVLGAAARSGDVAAASWAAVQLAMLALPGVGLALVAAVVLRRLAGAAAVRSPRLPRVALVALACFAAGVVLPLAIDSLPR